MRILRISPTAPLLAALALFAPASRVLAGAQSGESRPNVLVIFTDDLGYGDLACYGHPSIATPHLDRMAQEGQRWTQFTAAAPICSPSRAGLLTGRYPVRSGLARGVFFEWSAGGIPAGELTLAESLQAAGYRTGMIGKWHLGHREGYLPTRNGFESYFGVPYSNDMRVDPEMPVSDRIVFREGMTLEKLRDNAQQTRDLVPLLENEAVVEYPADQSSLTRRYTERALQFIEARDGRPFFLYYAQTFPHVPLFASGPFLGSSRRGLYGDVVQEIDDSVGRILDKLRETGLAENTLVIFTSDNGPWLVRGLEGGSAGLLRGGKGETWEGGFRVPAIFWWPGRIEPAVVRGMGSTLDLFATISHLAAAPLPTDRELDSFDLGPTLFAAGASPRDLFHYYRGDELFAIRKGPWKAHFTTWGAYRQPPERTAHNPPLLFNLDQDPSERFDVAASHPAIVEEMNRLYHAHVAETVKGEDQYAERLASQPAPAPSK